MMTAKEKHAQRMSALATGNRARAYRSNLKRDVQQGALDPEVAFLERDERLDGMLVEDYLRAVPGIGKERVLQARKQAWISPDTTFATLTDRQRRWLVLWLHDHLTQSQRYRDAVKRFRDAVA